LASDCLTRGLEEWQSNMTNTGGYGRDTSNVFRAVSASVFLGLHCTQEKKDVVIV
jgi:hypothetical protein